MAWNVDPIVDAQVGGSIVRIADLVRFQFASGEKRYWSGFSSFTDNNGETWDGAGNVGTVSSVISGTGQSINELVFTLIGDNTMLAKFSDSAEEATGRQCMYYQQFFDVRQVDDDGNWVDWKPLSTPIQLFWGIMGPLTADTVAPQAGTPDPRLRVITVRAANAFINRIKPAYGFYSSNDQLARSPTHDDFMFINASRMALTTVRWPAF